MIQKPLLCVVLLSFSLLFFSCKKEKVTTYTKERYEKVTDSLYQMRAQQIIKNAGENLEMRRKIELKQLTEELLQKSKHENASGAATQSEG